MKSNDAAGAVVGVMVRGAAGSYLRRCDNTGVTVQSATEAGGLVGRAGSWFMMENCINKGDVI